MSAGLLRLPKVRGGVTIKKTGKFGNLAKIFILVVNLVNGVKRILGIQTTNMNNFA